jgi:hypothetical protein
VPSSLMSLTVEGVPIIGISVQEDVAAGPSDQHGAALLVLGVDADPALGFVRLASHDLTLVIPRRIAGGRLSVAASVPAVAWFVGLDSTVYAIDWRAAGLTAEVELIGPVYSLHVVAPDEVVAVHEIGARRMDAQGRTLWRYETDVITEHAVLSDRLYLRCMDGSETVLHLDTGRPVVSS